MSSESRMPARDDRFEGNVYNIDIGDEMPDFENIECDPTEHVGDRAVVFVMGANDEDVRKVSMCTECQMVTQEVAFDDVQGITLEAVGTVRDRVKNYPGETDLEKISLADVLEMVGKDADEVDVTHAGFTEDELLIQTTEAETNCTDTISKED